MPSFLSHKSSTGRPWIAHKSAVHLQNPNLSQLVCKSFICMYVKSHLKLVKSCTFGTPKVATQHIGSRTLKLMFTHFIQLKSSYTLTAG